MKRGFTLIELLIVIAIIAILALIAVPNFLEAQTRAKVARVKGDMRAVATAIQSYFMDYSVYPISLGNIDHADGYHKVFDCRVNALDSLRTPVRYIDTRGLVTMDPFQVPDVAWGQSYFYLNVLGAVYHLKTFGDQVPVAWQHTSNPSPLPSQVNLAAPAPMQFNGKNGTIYYALWALASTGPDRSESDPQNDGTGNQGLGGFLKTKGAWNNFTVNAVTDFYDPTNGTQSRGNIWLISPGDMIR